MLPTVIVGEELLRRVLRAIEYAAEKLMNMVSATLAFAAALAMFGCPESKSGAPPTTCTKIGDSCTFAPGKLGLCVEPANCGAPICQSQH